MYRYIHGVMTEQDEERAATAVSNTTCRLSERETAILQHLANGLTSHALAREMGITFHVAQNTIKALRAKLGVNTATAIVAYGFRHKLIA